MSLFFLLLIRCSAFLQQVEDFFCRKTARERAEDEQLIEEACERGRVSALHNLSPETALLQVDCHLQHVALRRFKLLQPKADAVNAMLTALATEQAELERRAEGLLAHHVLRPARREPRVVRPLRAFMNAFALSALSALALLAIGHRPDWREWSALTICALFVALNWASIYNSVLGLPAETIFVVRLAAQRWTLNRIRARGVRLSYQQTYLRRGIADYVLRRSQANEWLAVMQPQTLSHFNYERARAERAVSIHRRKQEATGFNLQLGETPPFDHSQRSLAATSPGD